MPNHTQTGVIRGGFLQSVAQKGSHRSAILTPSRYRPFTGQVLEEAHHQHLKINHWVYPGTPIASLAIRRSAKPVHFLRKTHLGQDLLDSPKKPSGAQFRQSPSLYPKLFLLLRFLPLEHPTLITKNHWVFQQSARLSLRGLGMRKEKRTALKARKNGEQRDRTHSFLSTTETLSPPSQIPLNQGYAPYQNKRHNQQNHHIPDGGPQDTLLHCI